MRSSDLFTQGIITMPRPFFFTNFVSTLDGKVAVTTDPKAYWPIGSALDHARMMELRRSADILIHGKGTAHAHRTVEHLDEKLAYAIVTHDPSDALVPFVQRASGPRVIIVTTDRAVVSEALASRVEVMRCGERDVDLERCAMLFEQRGFHRALVEGGPRLVHGFFERDLIDEVFLTWAPKIFGGECHDTRTMVEGPLFPPNKIRSFHLISAEPKGDEIFLHYARETHSYGAVSSEAIT